MVGSGEGRLYPLPLWWVDRVVLTALKILPLMEPHVKCLSTAGQGITGFPNTDIDEQYNTANQATQ